MITSFLLALSTMFFFIPLKKIEPEWGLGVRYSNQVPDICQCRNLYLMVALRGIGLQESGLRTSQESVFSDGDIDLLETCGRFLSDDGFYMVHYRHVTIVAV